TGSLFSHFEMPVNSGAGGPSFNGAPRAAVPVAAPAAKVTAIASVLSVESMSKSFEGWKERGDPRVNQNVVLQIDSECGQRDEHLLRHARCARHGAQRHRKRSNHDDESGDNEHPPRAARLLDGGAVQDRYDWQNARRGNGEQPGQQRERRFKGAVHDGFRFAGMPYWNARAYPAYVGNGVRLQC